MKQLILIVGFLAVLSCAGCLGELPTPPHGEEEYSEINTFSEPTQTPHEGEIIYREADGREYTLVSVATYTAPVLVVGTKHYYDEDAELVPIDLCVVWGELAQPEYLQYADFIQEERGCECIYEEGSPVDAPDVLNQFVNMHLIPATETILQALKTIRNGQKVVLEGFLVDIYLDGEIYIETSTTRTDDGTGSCEILYVTKVRIGNIVYE